MSCGTPLAEEDIGGVEIPSEPTPSEYCVRCSKVAVTFVQSAAFCHECFLSSVRIKFLKGLEGAKNRSVNGLSWESKNSGKTRGSKRSRLLLAFSGGANSRALLDMVSQNFKTKVHNANSKAIPCFASIDVLYVDESGLPGSGKHDKTEQVRKIVETTGFGFLSAKLEEIFASHVDDDQVSMVLDRTTDCEAYFDTLSFSLTQALLFTVLSAGPSTSMSKSTVIQNLTPRQRLVKFVELHSPTSRLTLLRLLLQAHLRCLAREGDYEILLTGESSTRMSINVLKGLSEGRGYSIGEEVGCEWFDSSYTSSHEKGHEGETEDLRKARIDHPYALMCVRPLSLISSKECAYYARSRSLEGLPIERTDTKILEAKTAGIASLVEDFLMGLEDTFPSTVATVTRTAQKLGMRTEDARIKGSSDTSCPLCCLPAQVGAKDWKGANTMSTFADTRRIYAKPITGGTMDLASSSSSTMTQIRRLHDAGHIPLAQLLCYGCLLLLQDVHPSVRTEKNKSDDHVVHLPYYTKNIAETRWFTSNPIPRDISDDWEEELLEAPVEIRLRSPTETNAGVEQFFIHDIT